MSQDSDPSPSKSGLWDIEQNSLATRERRESVREALTSHTRLLDGRCRCGANAESTWLWIEHLTDVVMEVP